MKRVFEVEYYRLESGRIPVKEFIDGLEVGMRAKAIGSIELLAEYGNRLREPFSKAVGDGLFELRIRFSGDITRIFYFFFIGGRIVLTNGFVKKTVKTPATELEIARRYKKDYERRHPR